ncbi:hypothetical protein [Shewanella sp. UCD-KL21]|uniref:hypothetical protein n=1 Tax=Shewanella sp. UCD-KL21 TaxID=1917164 RepID=UPI000970EA2C|nr:hypothetical protein [Shewanella sp. UCD-KL21]
MLHTQDTDLSIDPSTNPSTNPSIDLNNIITRTDMLTEAQESTPRGRKYRPTTSTHHHDIWTTKTAEAISKLDDNDELCARQNTLPYQDFTYDPAQPTNRKYKRGVMTTKRLARALKNFNHTKQNANSNERNFVDEVSAIAAYYPNDSVLDSLIEAEQSGTSELIVSMMPKSTVTSPRPQRRDATSIINHNHDVLNRAIQMSKLSEDTLAETLDCVVYSYLRSFDRTEGTQRLPFSPSTMKNLAQQPVLNTRTVMQVGGIGERAARKYLQILPDFLSLLETQFLPKVQPHHIELHDWSDEVFTGTTPIFIYQDLNNISGCVMYKRLIYPY